MPKFTRSLSIVYDESDSAAAMIDTLKSAKSGRASELMRRWMKAGYLLDTISRSIVSNILDIDQDGLLEDLDTTQKADVLIRLLEQIKLQQQIISQVSARAVTVKPEPVVMPDPEPAPVIKKTRKKVAGGLMN